MVVRVEKISPEAKLVWARLSEEQRIRIQRNYPFRADRDRAIQRLRTMGISLNLLMELTGLRMSHLAHIVKLKSPKARAHKRIGELQNLIQAMEDLRGRLQTVEEILKERR